MLNILIADDHPLFRVGIKHIIIETSNLYVVDEASNGLEVLKKVREVNYDIILLDIAMPGENGIDILKQLKDEKPQIPVLMLSVHPEEQYAIRALRAGASGYLTKESTPGELITAINKALAGGIYVSSELAEKLALSERTKREQLPHEILSDREYQVLCMIAGGKTVTEIARELSMSVKTISTYRSRVVKKIGLRTNAQLVRYAVENKLLE